MLPCSPQVQWPLCMRRGALSELLSNRDKGEDRLPVHEEELHPVNPRLVLQHKLVSVVTILVAAHLRYCENVLSHFESSLIIWNIRNIFLTHDMLPCSSQSTHSRCPCTLCQTAQSHFSCETGPGRRSSAPPPAYTLCNSSCQWNYCTWEISRPSERMHKWSCCPPSETAFCSPQLCVKEWDNI